MSVNGSCVLNESVERPWGRFVVIAEGAGFVVKIIRVNPGQRLSVQSHEHRAEHWVVLSGGAKALVGKEWRDLHPGESIDIPAKEIHSLWNPSESDVEIVEVQRGDILREDDIVRYEDIYGRASVGGAR